MYNINYKTTEISKTKYKFYNGIEIFFKYFIEKGYTYSLNLE